MYGLFFMSLGSWVAKSLKASVILIFEKHFTAVYVNFSET